MDTRRIIELLRDRHSGKEWAIFVELRGSTGFINDQRIDFFAMHLWPSQRFRSIAYEIKVSRADFANEIARPNKRTFAESVSHESLFVVPVGLIRPDETPEGWGLMVADNGGLKVVKQPMQRREINWPPSFLASIARRSSDPGPALPSAAWRVLGKDVGEAELLEIAQSAYSTSLDRDRKDLIAEGRRLVTESPDYKELIAIRVMIGKAMGHAYPEGRTTPDVVRDWLAQEGRYAPINRHKVEMAIRLMRESLEGG